MKNGSHNRSLDELEVSERPEKVAEAAWFVGTLTKTHRKQWTRKEHERLAQKFAFQNGVGAEPSSRLSGAASVSYSLPALVDSDSDADDNHKGVAGQNNHDATDDDDHQPPPTPFPTTL